MSDKETEDDVGLPKATVFKLIQGTSISTYASGYLGADEQRSYRQIWDVRKKPKMSS
jgi:hypothetical protein